MTNPSRVILLEVVVTDGSGPGLHCCCACIMAESFPVIDFSIPDRQAKAKELTKV